MAHLPESASPVLQLEERMGCQWPAIRQARQNTGEYRKRLFDHFSALNSPDTSLVVFGSAARDEVTKGSDLDWILLVDGQSIPEHKDQELKIARLLQDGGFRKPGSSGVFGRMVGSHGLVHNIGGEDDLNSNTTRRILTPARIAPGGQPRSL